MSSTQDTVSYRTTYTLSTQDIASYMTTPTHVQIELPSWTCMLCTTEAPSWLLFGVFHSCTNCSPQVFRVSAIKCTPLFILLTVLYNSSFWKQHCELGQLGTTLCFLLFTYLLPANHYSKPLHHELNITVKWANKSPLHFILTASLLPAPSKAYLLLFLHHDPHQLLALLCGEVSSCGPSGVLSLQTRDNIRTISRCCSLPSGHRHVGTHIHRVANLQSQGDQLTNLQSQGGQITVLDWAVAGARETMVLS